MIETITRLRVLQVREEPASHGVTFPVQMRNLVTTEIRDNLADEAITAGLIKLPIKKRGARELLLLKTAKRVRTEADVLILGQGTALRMALLRAVPGRTPKMVMITYDPFPFYFPDKVLTPKERVAFFVRKQLYQSLDGLLVHSRGQVRFLTDEIGLKNVLYVPMAIDLERFSPAETARGDFLLLTDGALRDYETLASAIEKMRVKPTELVVVHRNALSPIAEDSLARIRAAGTTVTLKYRLSQEELIDLYRTCQGVVVPILSSYQPAGLTQMLEAAAVACPIACTGGPYLEEYLEPDREALLTPPGDAQKLAESLEKIVTSSDKRLQLSRAAYARSRSFNFEDSLEVLRDVLKTL